MARKVCPVCGMEYSRLELQRKNDGLYLLAVHNIEGRRVRCYIGRVGRVEDPHEAVVEVARQIEELVERGMAKPSLLIGFASFLRQLADEVETIAKIHELKDVLGAGKT